MAAVDYGHMDRDQLVAHLELHGWEPVANSAGERAILRREDGLAFLAWWPDGRDGYGSGVNTMRITPSISNKSTIAPSVWDVFRDAELPALIEAWQTYERVNA